MRVLFWVDGFWPRLGGAETAAMQLIEGMQARGHQCTILAQRDHPSWKEEDRYGDIPIRRFDFNGVIAKQSLAIMPVLQSYLEWLIREFQPDILHLNGFERGNGFIFLLLKKMFRIPVVITAHGPYLQGKFDDHLCPPVMERIATSVDQICCVSNWVLQEVGRALPTVKNKLKLIYNGLPMPAIMPEPLPFSPPTLLLFGRLSWEKGFDTAIEAFALLKKGGSNAQLIIAGGGPERASLERLVSELGVEESVRFIGVLAPEEVFTTFNKATIVVVPSILESFGLVILQSMQMQRPVVASRVQGVPEVVSDGETGILFSRQDPVALCQAVESLLQQPEKAIRMGVEGRKRAMQFTLERNVAQYEELYEALRSR